MKKITQNELNDIIYLHGLWLNRSKSGIQADLSGLDLSGLYLGLANLKMAKFMSTPLSITNFNDANLSGACLRYADLKGVSFANANLLGADLNGTDLTCANFRGANLYHAKLIYSYINGTNFDFANLTGADLNGCISGVDELGNYTSMIGTILTDAKGHNTSLRGVII